MLKGYAEQRKEKIDAAGVAVSAAIEVKGGALPREVLDEMSWDDLWDTVKAKEGEVERSRISWLPAPTVQRAVRVMTGSTRLAFGRLSSLGSVRRIHSR